MLALVTGIPEQNIRVNRARCGGAFGSKLPGFAPMKFWPC